MLDTCKTQSSPCRTANPVADNVTVEPRPHSVPGSVALAVAVPGRRRWRRWPKKVTLDPSVLMSGEEDSTSVISSDRLSEGSKLEEEQQMAEAMDKPKENRERKRIRFEAKVAAIAEAEGLEKERLHALQLAEQHLLEEQYRLQEQHRKTEKLRVTEQRRLIHKAAEQAEQAKNEAAKRRVQQFLKDHGFSSVNAKKTSFMSHKYALHSAVKRKDVETVSALLWCNADPSLQNSSNKTPEQLASSLNKNGSHDQVLTVLRAIPNQ